MANTYSIAKTVLNENDMGRLLCACLHTDNNGKIDWDAAAKDYGSASAGSFRRMHSDAKKKVSDAVRGQSEATSSASPGKHVKRKASSLVHSGRRTAKKTKVKKEVTEDEHWDSPEGAGEDAAEEAFEEALEDGGDAV